LKWENQGSVHVAYALKNKPFTFEENIFCLEVENELIEEEMNNYKEELLHFLRKECKNGSIQLKITISQQHESGNKLYTSRDKLNYLIEKYPLVAKLKDELKLDTDF